MAARRAAAWAGYGFFDHVPLGLTGDIALIVVSIGFSFVLPLLVLYQAIVGNWFVSIPMTIIMIVAGFLFVSVSAYLAGLVGSSNNPVSGITIATILFAALVLVLLLGADSPIGAVAAIMIGAVVCCAAAVGGDNLQDLKAGYIVGATPWKQQLMLMIGAFSCALIMAPVLNLLAAAYGIGPPTVDQPNSLAAPQATLMASVAKGIFGGELPWGMIGLGAIVGAVIIALGTVVQYFFNNLYVFRDQGPKGRVRSKPPRLLYTFTKASCTASRASSGWPIMPTAMRSARPS